MKKQTFTTDEGGAVTTDFAVLMLAVILIPLAVASQVNSGTVEVGNAVSQEMAGMVK